ncbi:lamin tail domain-containing protein [Thermococcus sp. M36]|uniref:lamin tail domain-containing protein n=1 Tax=Thermococcus sp. M36 TaxID=1638261 RepID=UPI0014394E23|nr:lamin tail domain-containing protein [Thermococcus sp. M36]NJE06186.1 lamin tail domain-containing protein [Thermococcus sp. M36]
MRRAQGLIEHLFMLAVAIGVVAFTIYVVIGLLSTNSENPKVVISYVDYNPPGSDVSGEYVLITNEGSADVDMGGWKLMDESNHVYTFPAGFILKAGASVKVHTGEGTDTETDLYWGRKQAVWNNDGDTAYLYDAEGNLVDSCSWSGKEGGAVSCH